MTDDCDASGLQAELNDDGPWGDLRAMPTEHLRAVLAAVLQELDRRDDEAIELALDEQASVAGVGIDLPADGF